MYNTFSDEQALSLIKHSAKPAHLFAAFRPTCFKMWRPTVFFSVGFLDALLSLEDMRVSSRV
jgi:hypothetical protein